LVSFWSGAGLVWCVGREERRLREGGEEVEGGRRGG
jgi:hypothetical protein